MAQSSDMNCDNSVAARIAMENAKSAYDNACASAEAARVTAREATNAYCSSVGPMQKACQDAIKANEAFLRADADVAKLQLAHHDARSAFLEASHAAPYVIEHYQAIAPAITARHNIHPPECEVLRKLCRSYYSPNDSDTDVSISGLYANNDSDSE